MPVSPVIHSTNNPGPAGNSERRAHILIIRLSAMGDVAMTAPVVAELRRANPALKITILTRPFFKPFFRDIEGVDFIFPDLKGRHSGLAGMVRLWGEIKNNGITHVADLHDVLRTKLLRTLFRTSGARVSVIDKGRKEKKELTRKQNKIKKQLTTTIERYREAISVLGFEIPEPVPVRRSPIPPGEAVTSLAGEKDGTWIALAPFAKHKGKIYPLELCTELTGLLSARYGRIFLFGGGPYEQEFAEAMEQKYPNVVSVIGKLSLDDELDLISNMDAMVSMDSSSMHMASLVGVPTVSVWGATHPFAGFYGFGQDPQNAVGLDLPCRPCSVYGNKECMYGDYRCMSAIDPETIAAKVASVIQMPKSRAQD